MIRTAKEYVDSLNDGRITYLNGERVPDVTKHKFFRGGLNARAMFNALCEHPDYRDLLTYEENGERFSFAWQQPKSAEDLVRRRHIYITGMKTGGVINGVGPDALAASGVTAAQMDKELGTHYSEAVEDYRNHLKKTDPKLTGAITDVKGDRGLKASEQVQHKDFYVRVVDKNKDGIIVRGAKIHISDSTWSNEMIVSPSKAHGEADKDYAVVFATPMNAKGIRFYASPGDGNLEDIDTEHVDFDWPIWGRNDGVFGECMIVFDDVFIPWNRVFMCGEWQFSRAQAWNFGLFHRLFATCAKTVQTEWAAGIGALLAEYNGVDKYPHIRQKLAWLSMHAHKIDCLAQYACEHPDIFPELGLAAPNMTYINMAKYEFANDAHETSKLLADIGGGLIQTIMNHRDWMNPEERPDLEKYLAGKAGIPTEHRIRLMRLAKDTLVRGDVTPVNGEGSLATQIMAMYAGTDWNKYKNIAKRMAGIPGWENDPDLKRLPPHPIDWILES